MSPCIRLAASCAFLLCFHAAPVVSKKTHSTSKQHKQCNLTCQNGGECVKNTISLDHPTSNYLPIICSCPPGYRGILCEIKPETCDSEGDLCRNGEPCTRAENTDDIFQCTCNLAYEFSENAGEMCDDPVTSFCTDNVAYIMDRFCTNGGSCRNTTLDGKDSDEGSEEKEHLSCDCLDGFEGEHCELFTGISRAKPTVALEAEPTSTPTPLFTRIVHGFFLGICCVGFLWAAAIINKNIKEHKLRLRYNAEAAIATAELALDFDDDPDTDFELEGEEEEIEIQESYSAKGKGSPPKKVHGDTYALVGFT